MKKHLILLKTKKDGYKFFDKKISAMRANKFADKVLKMKIY